MKDKPNPPPPDAYLDKWIADLNRTLGRPQPERHDGATPDIKDFLRCL